jgi:hypothetical protein
MMSEGTLFPVEVYRIYPNGRQELVRGGNLVGISHSAIRDVILTGDKQFVFNYFRRIGLFRVRETVCSFVGRSLLFEDLEYQLIDKNFAKPPDIQNPLFIGK